MEVISALRFLNLPQVPQAWVDDSWDLDFLELRPLPELLEEQLSDSDESDFRKLHQCFLSCAEQPPPAEGAEASQSLWSVLGDGGLSVRSLVSVLSYFVLRAKAPGAGVKQRVQGLHAASLYLLLLGVPGSVAYQSFHELLLDSCSDLSALCWPQDSGRKRKKDLMKSSQADGKRSRPPRRDPTEFDEDDEEEEELHFSNSDLMKIRDVVFLLVQSLLRLLQSFSFRDRPQTLSNFTRILTRLLYFEPVLGEVTFAAAQDVSRLRTVPELAFYGLQLLCSPKQGDQTESLRRVFHNLLYVVLMMKKTSGGKPSLLPISPPVLTTRDHTVHFICFLVKELKPLASPYLNILLQHICAQMVEKSEYRGQGSVAVSMLMSQMTLTDHAHFIRWLFSFSRSSKMVHRLFSVDVVLALLENPERSSEDQDQDLDQDLSWFLTHRFLIQNLLFSRLMDDAPTVEGHALSALAKCLDLTSFNATQAVHELFSHTGTPTVLESETIQGEMTCQQKTYRSLPFRTVEINSSDSLSCDAKENLALLVQRVKDSKTNVRKSALQALVGLMRHSVVSLSPENLVLLSDRCRDPAVSVKKKALQCLGELLTSKPECRAVQKAWLQGVVPAVLDAESSVQDKALEALDQALLQPATPFSAGRPLDTSQRLMWDLLGLLSQDCQNLRRYFSRAFSIWSKQGRFSSSLIGNILSHTEAGHAPGAWLLLSKVVAFNPNVSLGKILEAWERMVSWKETDSSSCCHILRVMGNIAAQFNDDTKQRIVDELVSWVKTLKQPLAVVSAAVDTLYQLGRTDDLTLTQAFMNRHGGELLSDCESYLASIFLKESGAESINEELLIKKLHLLGVVSLHCPSKVGKRTLLLVESVLTAPSQRPTEIQDELPASVPLSQFRENSLPATVRAHGVLTLGKLCLQHKDLVQKYLPVFARELEVGQEVAVRNNVVVVMCDLCVRYTTIVDHYIPNISACLRDSEAVIREQTLVMLTNLLQEEFVKWKGSLFFRYMVALVDPNPAIASLCRYCLLHLLLKRNPEMFSQHFIESIFHFNSYDQHKSYNKFPQTESEKQRFSLRGPGRREQRFQIYRFLLENFTDAQRFNICNKINTSILACFADEELALDEDGAVILSETFGILSLKEMKLQVVSAPAGAEEVEEENMAATTTKALLQTAQSKVVSQVQKKAFVENTVPLVISLKNLLEQKRSPVLRDLMAFLQVKMQEHRQEVKEFFSADEQLAVELEFALKAAEKEKEMEEQMKNCTLSRDVQVPQVQDPVQSPVQVQDAVQGSSVRSRFSLPMGFTTPQPSRPIQLSVRLTRTERSKKSRSRSMDLEKTGFVEDRAISTPKAGTINVTFGGGLSAIFSERESLGTETSVLDLRPPGSEAEAMEPATSAAS